jgi:hypothetical protein
MFAGHPVMTGGPASLTVTTKEQVAEFPAVSVKAYVTVVIPIGNVVPGMWLADDDAMAQLSVAVGGVQVTDAPEGPVALVVIFAGHPVITGASLSRTVTSKEHVAALPAVSVKVYVTVVVPTGNVGPGV